MRKIILIGATGLALALGAASAFAQPIPAGGSPYDLNNAPSGSFSTMVEGRAAYTDAAPTANSNPIDPQLTTRGASMYNQ